MLINVDNCYFYKRISNVLIAVKTNGEEVPLVKFKQNFIDLQIVGKQPFEYIKKYVEMFPELVEKIEPKKITEQLKLF